MIQDTTKRSSTGNSGLDEVLVGGFERDRLHLIEGMPGSGKTTLGLQFVLEGVRRGEPVLYVTLSETADELREVVRSHGWSLDGVAVHELVPSERSLEPDEQYTVFHPAEVELAETIGRILEEIDRARPRRVVVDSLSEMRLLAASPLRFRRQVLALKQFFSARGCTSLLLDDGVEAGPEMQVRSIAHSVLLLEVGQTEYGADRRRLRILKYRGTAFRGGYHDFSIRRGGLEIYPRLVAAEHRADSEIERFSSGVPELDALLGGGLERGTSTLIAGAAGTGKSTLAAHFVTAAAQRGHRGAMYLFDESLQTLRHRTEGLGIGLAEQIDAGRVHAQPVDPAELSPGELIHNVRRNVEEHDAAVVVLDSLNGYLNALPGERHLTIQLHELLMYLGQRRVVTLLVGAQRGLISGEMATPVDASYLADAVILLRYFEAEGELRKVVSVVKKRTGVHERTLRELHFGSGGIEVREPIRGFHGVLSGLPEPIDPRHLGSPPT